MGLIEVEREYKNYIYLTQYRVQWQSLVNMCLRVPKSGEFLDYLSDYQLLKTASALWSSLVHIVWHKNMMVFKNYGKN
jgi:hypothetical protein